MKERALLVTADFQSLPRDHEVRDAAAELEDLCLSAGLQITRSLVFRQRAPQAPLLIGKGKAEEIRALVEKDAADTVVMESELSSSQQRNLEKLLGAKTIDRTQLILDIFAQRAKSNEGKLQVELAQLKYLLPRLSDKDVELSRLGGGVGTRGPGEQKLEVDRRRIRLRIARLSDELNALQKRRLAGLEKKKEKDMPLVALVGYTNAGKSSVFNRLTGSDARVKNQLFSTLDTVTRAMELQARQKALLVDTVGFVRHLPHHLVESFKATLEETVHADLLLHVIDSSRADSALLEKAVQQVLEELGAEIKKTLLVYNKIDLVSPERKAAIARNMPEGAVLVSALTGQGMEELISKITRTLFPGLYEKEFFLPGDRMGLLDFLYEKTQVLARRDTPDGCYLTVKLSAKAEETLQKRLTAGKGKLSA